MLVPQITGVIAWFERTLTAARAQDRVGGNPALCSHQPRCPAQITAAREQTRMATLLPCADTWLTRDDLTK